MANHPRQRKSNDIEELENTFQTLAGKNKSKVGKYAKSGRHFSAALIIGLCIAMILVVAGGIFIVKTVRDNQIIEANLTVIGVNVTGMTRKDAESAIDRTFHQLYDQKELTVSIDQLSQTIPASVSQVKLDAEAAIDAAIEQVNTGSTVQALDVTQYLSIDKEAVFQILQEFVPHYTSTLVQSTYEIIGTLPTAFDQADETIKVALQITKGNPGAELDLDALLLAVLTGYSDGNHTVSFDCPLTEPESLDFDAINTEHCIAAVEAEFEPETFEVIGGTWGYAFDAAEAADALDKAEYNEVVSVPFQWIEPEMTAAELEDTLFRDVLSTYTTYASSNYDRNINLVLAAEAINGVVLYPGDVFSYNETLGERTPEKGYRPGASYVNGETVLDYGGGICQVTSTLYYCTIVADLEIIERECHGYASSYTPLSTDATVFWNGIDFKFRNNSEYPIRIEASSANGDVTVSLIGTDTKDYYVKFESVWLETYPFETVYKEMEADNKKGYKDGDILTDPYTGYKSEGYRARYDKVTNELIERVLESTDRYSSRNKVICKIIGAETEPPTEPETTVTPTEPPQTTPPQTEPETEAPQAPEETTSEPVP